MKYFASTYRNQISSVKSDSTFCEVTREEANFLLLRRNFTIA